MSIRRIAQIPAKYRGMLSVAIATARCIGYALRIDGKELPGSYPQVPKALREIAVRFGVAQRLHNALVAGYKAGK